MFGFTFNGNFWEWYRTFAPSIPVPELYWNVVSPEQRIHDMCHMLACIREYCATMGKKVDEIDKILNDIIEGKLDPIIEQAISDWFDENQPEIMQDIADLKAEDITINGRIDGVYDDLAGWVYENDMHYSANTFISPTITPTYVGDAIQSHQLGCCVRVGNIMHLLWGSNAASSGIRDENGIIQSFNLSTNAEDSIITDCIIGHANSVCYDTVRNCFWVAPHWSVSNYSESDIYAIYRFDAAWDNRSSFPFDFWPFAVTHDPITRNTYMLTRQGRESGGNYISSYLYILRPDAINFEFFAEIPDSVDHNRELGTYQDCACYDNNFFIITTRAEMYQFRLDDNSEDEKCEYIKAYTVDCMDSGGIWSYGEIEGIEFDLSGNLYNARNNYFTTTNDPDGYGYLNNGFITQLYTKPRTLRNTMQHGSGKNLTLSPTTIAKFKLANSEIRHTSQVSLRHDLFARLNITGGVITEAISRMSGQQFAIDVATGATWEVMQIQPYGSDISLTVEGTISQYQPSLQEPYTTFISSNDQYSSITVNNRGSISLSNDITLFYNSRYAPNVFACVNLGNLASMNVNGTNITAPALMVRGLKAALS